MLRASAGVPNTSALRWARARAGMDICRPGKGVGANTHASGAGQRGQVCVHEWFLLVNDC
jgi:hypothetical protein